MTISVKFESVTKILGQSRAVDNLTLAIGAGELFFLLGPSGCGKTTALRLVAGFYVPDEGRIFLNERDQSRVPPHKRNTCPINFRAGSNNELPSLELWSSSRT